MSQGNETPTVEPKQVQTVTTSTPKAFKNWLDIGASATLLLASGLYVYQSVAPMFSKEAKE